MDLFDYMKETTMEKESPLASRMRPTTLDEVVGQEHIIGPGKLLYRAIKVKDFIKIQTKTDNNYNLCKHKRVGVNKRKQFLTQ